MSYQDQIDTLTALLASAICRRHADRSLRLSEALRVADVLHEAVAEHPIHPMGWNPSPESAPR